MSALQYFASMLGIAQHQAEDALHAERAAHAVLSRRSFFAAGAALASGLVMVEIPTVDPTLELLRMINRFKQQTEEFWRLNQLYANRLIAVADAVADAT